MENSSDKKKIIVSLTSFPGAISYAEQAIYSILNGTILPDKIVLYITLSRFEDNGIPQGLLKLSNENPIFEIRDYNPDIRSYQKLVPALNDFPNDVIVTIDDDIFYHKNMLHDLIRLHKRLPNAIIAHRVRKVLLNKPYSKWRKYSLDTNMLDSALFSKIAPTNDDIWFWAAAVSKGTYVVPVPGWHHKLVEIGKPREFSLKTINLKPGDDRNREAFEKILEAYPIVKQRIENE